MTEKEDREYWYRFEDHTYSVADEWGDHHHSSYEIKEYKFPVVRHTPKGVIISAGTWGGEEKFICHNWRKKYACATKEEALSCLIARKNREASIHEARAAQARTFQKMAEERLTDLTYGLPILGVG